MFARINSFIVSTWLAAREERGQATTEYALVLALLVAGAVVAMGVLTGALQNWMTTITNGISGSVPFN